MARDSAPAIDSEAPGHGAGRSRRRGAEQELAEALRGRVEERLAAFPWPVQVEDWRGERYRAGGQQLHWCGRPLELRLRRPEAGRRLLAGDAMGFLEGVLAGDADLEGNLYLLPELRQVAGLELGLAQALRFGLRHLAFQNQRRARLNVKSHYDIPQAVLDRYLDCVYRAYSTGIFEQPTHLDVGELLRAGEGRDDDFDSLEKSQWRKFQDAIDFIAPQSGDRLLDVGCGYGGQLRVALESHRLGRYVGWTHSRNQVHEGRRLLAGFDPERWELNEGDYRSDDRLFDHVTSTGMVSHVGPRGLVPYVRQVRCRIRSGGRYLHHALMRVHEPRPLDLQIGPVFHKRFVWPGFHWFTLGSHVRALERNGFEVLRLVNLADHYAKTTAAWYERLESQREEMRPLLGEPTLRAWRLFLAGSSGDLARHGIHVYRLYCRAV